MIRTAKTTAMLAAAVALIAGLRVVPAIGAGLDGTTTSAAATAGADPASLRPAGPAQVGPWKVLSGSLHDHTTDSDGDTDSPTVAAWVSAHHKALGIDYDTFTDHSDFFPVAYSNTAAPVDQWSRQAQLDAQYTNPPDGFSLLRGFELTNDQENHLNVIGSQNWTSRFSAAGEASLRMEPFYKWLSTAPVVDPTGRGLGYGGADGVGQFNHPGDKGALNWDDYAYNADAAKVMSTIEIRGDQSVSANGLSHSDAGWYWFALSQGWTVSPTMNWDWHNWQANHVIDPGATPGANCGDDHSLPCQRSLVLAGADTPDAIMAALKARRTSASELPDLWATLRSGDTWQGSTVEAAPGQRLKLTIDAGTSTGSLRSVDIVADNGVSPFPYYYGDNAPCDVTEPPDPGDPTQNCDPENFSHSQLTISYVEQHRRYATSGGHATRKARIDGPPPGTVVATVPLSGTRDKATVSVTVPVDPSIRPDGKHFYYAIVHADAPAASGAPAGAARAWTGPILTSGLGSPTGHNAERVSCAAPETWQETGVDYFTGAAALTRSQGAATDGTSVMFSWQGGLERTDSSYATQAINPVAIPPDFLLEPKISADGTNHVTNTHIGDIDVYDGKIYAPIEDGGEGPFNNPEYQNPYVALFDAQTLLYTGTRYAMPLDKSRAGVPWVAVNPTAGEAYTAEWDMPGQPDPASGNQLRDAINVFDLQMHFRRLLFLSYGSDVPPGFHLSRIQGAKMFGGALYATRDDADKTVFKIDVHTGAVTKLFSLHLQGEMEGLVFRHTADGADMHVIFIHDNTDGTKIRTGLHHFKLMSSCQG